jgi:hypothetical protein
MAMIGPKRDMKPVLFRSEEYTNRMISEVLPDGSWKGKKAFIVGGGPSLQGFDFKKLKGHRVIGCNRAYEFFDPTIAFSMDTRFLHWVLGGKYGADALSRFNKYGGYKVWLLTYVASLREEIFYVPAYSSYEKSKKAFPMKSGDGLGHGINSGYGALNLAVCLGANPIYLLGFDCSHKNGKTHHHTGHPVPQNADTAASFIPYFNGAAAACKKGGVRVVNLNRASALKCFEFGDIEEALAC